MAAFSRKDARIAVYELLFEAEIRKNDTPDDIITTATEVRDIPNDDYIKEVFYGVINKKSELDEMIEKHAQGWKLSRISVSALCAMRICIYEMKYLDDIPMPVSINEAIEITKCYDDEKARAFVNGVLNSIKADIGA